MIKRKVLINYFTEYLDSPLLKTRLENLYSGDPEKQQAVIDAREKQDKLEEEYKDLDTTN